MRILSSYGRAFGAGWLFADLERVAACAWEVLISSYVLAFSSPPFAVSASHSEFLILLTSVPHLLWLIEA